MLLTIFGLMVTKSYCLGGSSWINSERPSPVMLSFGIPILGLSVGGGGGSTFYSSM